ncbi:unnamed protein product [Oppiella nova]|uniref:Uncharacterized protein n=1 Tax=Oppiella nova TaxID=334625 RepID=A0A7R9MJN9_9ACAR|nr:unnamed protein product [Oppiella nova]CAG2177639.1 unnamed protein product [Oppiella nova]
MGLSDCSEQEKQDLSEWFANVEGFFANETCRSHTRHSPQCLNIMMSKLDIPELPTPSLPTPLAIDCLGNIKRDVRLECANVSEYKWNVTVWDDLDCLREIAWVRCMPIELAVTEEYFRKNQLINWTERAGCDLAPYHSDVCILPDDNKDNNLTIDMTIELVTSNTNESPEIVHVPEDTDIVIELVQTNSDEPPKSHLDVPDNFTSINLDNNNTNINMTKEPTDTVISEFTPSIDPPRAPRPDPLTIDCLGSIKRDVRLECNEVSKLRWNISTHTHPPLENVYHAKLRISGSDNLWKGGLVIIQ